MGFTETWLDCNNVDCASFNGFTATHTVRMDNDILKETGGGLSIFVRDGIDFKVRENMKLMLPYIETLFIEFSYEGIVEESQHSLIDKGLEQISASKISEI